MRNAGDVVRAYYVDVDHDDIGEIAFTLNLNEMRRLTGSEVISIYAVRIDGKRYRVICPYDATDPDNPKDRKVSALDEGHKVLMRGSLVIVDTYMDGKDEVIRSMNDDQLDHIKDRMALVDIGSGSGTVNTYVVCDMEMEL